MRILVVVGRYPWPPRRGDQLRAHQALTALAAPAGGHEVMLLAPRAAGEAGAPPVPLAGTETYRFSPLLVRLVAVAGAALAGAPLQQGLFASRDLARRLERLARGVDLVLLQLARLERYVPQVGRTPLLVDLIDSLALNLETRAAHDRPLLRPALRAEARRLAASEERLVTLAARSVVVAGRDRAAILARRPDLASLLAVVPLGIGALAGDAGARPAPVSTRPRAIFTGNLGYFPNRDAARYLLDELWPRLHRAHPELELVLAGDRPGRRLRQAAQAAGSTLIASPPSLPELLAGATVALAPLRCGSGVPVKVLEAWAAGVPVVGSPWAAAAVEDEAGEALAVAVSPEEWVLEVGRLLSDEGERRRRVSAGRELLRLRHAPERVAEAWRAAALSAATKQYGH